MGRLLIVMAVTVVAGAGCGESVGIPDMEPVDEFRACLGEGVCSDVSRLSRCLAIGGLDAFLARCGAIYDTSTSPHRYRVLSPPNVCDERKRLTCCDELNRAIDVACRAVIGE